VTIERKQDTKSKRHQAVHEEQQEQPAPQRPHEQRQSTDDQPVRGRPLHGAKAIADYCDMSICTVMKWIHFEGMPASTIGGIWISDSSMIDRWLLTRIERDTETRMAERYSDYTGKPARW
jgi:hypothetical protein